ncbi:MAG: tetratricopeptide repeat protein [Emcibacteraceae bacterium]|nr:tetratricopeptide repeat protein [Emcibacteraceae bacterium]
MFIKLVIFLITIICFSTNFSLAQSNEDSITASVKQYDLANIAMMKKQDQQAYEHLKNAASLDPSNSTFINSAGYMAMHLGHFDISLNYLNQSLTLDKAKFGENHPNVASILNNMGSVYSKMGDDEKAVSYYDEAYKIIAGKLGEKHPQVLNIKKIRDQAAARIK